MWFSLLMLGMMGHEGKQKPFRDDHLNWTFFPLVQNQMRAKSKMWMRRLKWAILKSFFTLAISGDSRRRMQQTNGLDSILELLVTHNPDYNRFNVEESIGNNFDLKVALLTYLNGRTVNIDQLGHRLKVI